MEKTYDCSKACPIGLECLTEGLRNIRQLSDGGWCGNASYCKNLAAPMDLPYLYDYWESLGVLHVWIPYCYVEPDYDESMWEYEIIAQEAERAWVNRLRQDYIEAGWLDAEWLPYFYDSDRQAVIVWRDREEHNFYIAVSLEKKPRRVILEDRLDEYGFPVNWNLIEFAYPWMWDNQQKAWCNEHGECFYFENEEQPLNRTIKTKKQINYTW